MARRRLWRGLTRPGEPRHNDILLISGEKEQRPMPCGPAEGVSTTSSHGRPNSQFLVREEP